MKKFFMMLITWITLGGGMLMLGRASANLSGEEHLWQMGVILVMIAGVNIILDVLLIDKKQKS